MKWLAFLTKITVAVLVLAVFSMAAENIQCGIFENEGTKFLEQTTQNGIEYSLKRTFGIGDNLRCAEYVAVEGEKGIVFCHRKNRVSDGIACSYDGPYDKSVGGAISNINLNKLLVSLIATFGGYLASFLFTAITLPMTVRYFFRLFFESDKEDDPRSHTSGTRSPRPVFDGVFDEHVGTSSSAPREARPKPKPVKFDNDPPYSGEDEGVRKVVL